MIKNILTLCSMGAFLALISGFEPQKEDVPAQIQLGEKLFFDPILSIDSSISCGSCHRPEFAFADTATLSLGVGGQRGLRNTPSVMNMSARAIFFYDGRAATLEEQVFHPVRDPREMGLAVTAAVDRIRRHPSYAQAFRKAFGHKPDSARIGRALALYIRTLESPGDAPSDLWINNRDTGRTMSAAAIRGRRLFINKAKCFDCHFSPDFTGDEFRNIGLFDGQKNNDMGRFVITKDSADLGKMKVPGLRNVALTAPYMHDGRFKTLAEVVEYYDNPRLFIQNPINIDPLLAQPLGLSAEEKSDIVAFLQALTDAQFKAILK